MSEEEKTPQLKRDYVVPIRKYILNYPRWKRTPRAVRVLKGFIKRHMKTEVVKIDPALNELLWKRGAKHPPPKIKVTAIKFEDGSVLVTLPEESETE